MYPSFGCDGYNKKNKKLKKKNTMKTQTAYIIINKTDNQSVYKFFLSKKEANEIIRKWKNRGDTNEYNLYKIILPSDIPVDYLMVDTERLSDDRDNEMFNQMRNEAIKLIKEEWSKESEEDKMFYQEREYSDYEYYQIIQERYKEKGINIPDIPEWIL